MSLVKTVSILLITTTTALLPAVALTQSGPSEAPLPPPIQAPDLPEGRGFIPPPFDLSHLAARKPTPNLAQSLPSSWDWREHGVVTAVRNQSVCGACYAFASAACFESKIREDGGTSYDFSENSIKECMYWQSSCDGGNFTQVADWLSKAGTVLESCDPYVAPDVACDGGCQYQKTLLDWHIICGSVAVATSELKQFLYENGPVYTTLYAGDGDDAAWSSEMDYYDGSYTLRYTGTYAPNHAVLIVGWDDTLTHAGGTGGWIVKNSWGTSWGGTCGYGTEGGYFTIAYGSASIGEYSSYVGNYQDYDGNGDLYFRDEGGWTTSFGGISTTAYGMCKYTLTENQYITRVEFWTNDATTDIDIYLYDDFDGSTASNLIASKLDTSFTEAGYHSVPLPSPPEIAAGEDVFAMVKITNGSYVYPIVSDNTDPVTPATSWFSSTAQSGTWFDMGDDPYLLEAGIRIRTSPTLALGVEDDPAPLPEDFELGYNYPNPFNPATTISYSLEENAPVQIVIYNVLGQQVRDLIDEEQMVGEHEVVWDGRTDLDTEASTGIYFYRLQVGQQTQVRKMLLLR